MGFIVLHFSSNVNLFKLKNTFQTHEALKGSNYSASLE